MTKSYVFNSVLLPSDVIFRRETVLVEMPCDLEEANESQCSWGKSSTVESWGAFHLSRNSGRDANRTHVFRAFHWKILKRQPCFPVRNFPVEMNVPFTSFHKESPVSCYSRQYLCHHFEFLGREHKRMELVSNGTRSSLDGPFHGRFRKVLVNGKRPPIF